MVQRVHKVQQIGSLFYLQRNVRASWLALRMITFGLYLPNIQSSCVIARCLNNKHNVFFVAEKTCRNVAVLISNCDSMTMSKKLKILLTFPDYTAGDPVRKIFIKRRFTDSKDRRVRAAGMLPFHITEWVNIQLVARLVHILQRQHVQLCHRPHWMPEKLRFWHCRRHILVVCSCCRVLSNAYQVPSKYKCNTAVASRSEVSLIGPMLACARVKSRRRHCHKLDFWLRVS